jgi:hypothetical protein
MISYFRSAVILASACLISIALVVPGASARGEFDGTWSAVSYTSSGVCAPSYRGVAHVTDGIIHLEGVSANSFSGRVSQGGP